MLQSRLIVPSPILLDSPESPLYYRGLPNKGRRIMDVNRSRIELPDIHNNQYRSTKNASRLQIVPFDHD